MIVPSMTIEELYKEIMRDFASVKRKGFTEGNLLQKEMMRKKIQAEVRNICYKTIHRNEWQIVFQMTCRFIKTSFHIRSRDSKGPVAYTIQFYNQGTEHEDHYVIKYNSHFFKRYNERMYLGLTDSAKAVKHFFKNNFDYEIGESEMLPNGIRCTHFIYEEGMGIGYQDDAKKTIYMKTFISNDTLSQKLRNLAEHIKYGGDDEEFQQVIQIKNLENAFA